jgi:hypothetical protein
VLAFLEEAVDRLCRSTVDDEHTVWCPEMLEDVVSA